MQLPMLQNISDFLRTLVIAVCASALPLFSSELNVDPVREAVVRIDNCSNGRCWATVSFIPVRLFNEADNDEINSALAVNYAFNAMSSKLNKSELKAVVSHSKKVLQKENRVSYQVSLSNIRTEQSNDKASVSSPVSQSVIFTRKSDYEKIIAAIHRSAEQRLSRIMQQEMVDASKLKYLQQKLDSIADANGKLWKQLQDEIADDVSLFSTEADALKKIIESNVDSTQQQYFRYKCELDELQQAFEQFSKYQSVMLSRKFAGLLTSVPILCECGGAQLIYTSQGIPAIVAIAGGEVSGDLSRVRKKAQCRAMEQLLHLKYGTQMTSFTGKTTIISTVKEADGQEQGRVQNEFKRVLCNFSEGQIRSLPLVGCWYSSDRKMFYVAIGKIITEQ